jgi:HrpA-like RNA helicase
VLEVAGKMFPVQELCLEEALAQGAVLDLLARAEVPRRRQKQADHFSGTSGKTDGPEVSQRLLGDAGHRAGRAGADVLRGPHCEGEDASAALVAAVVAWLVLADPLAAAGGGGFGEGGAASAVLVFLPGTQDIRDVETALAGPPFRDSLGGRALVLPLHGSLSSEEQGRVFGPPPQGMRKVILATNVAESSVTIDDVAYVVNTGKLKERRFDATSGVSTLQSHWASAANNKQRRGRAGRVRPGLCVHLFVAGRRERLQPFQTPEMLRVPLEELCLTIKALALGRAAPVLAEALEPPKAEAVAAAVATLTGIGALDGGTEELTPLGRSLAQARRYLSQRHSGRALCERRWHLNRCFPAACVACGPAISLILRASRSHSGSQLLSESFASIHPTIGALTAPRPRSCRSSRARARC